MNIKTKEDYLRVIYSLYETLEDKSDGVRTSDIAKLLEVTKPTVSRGIRSLTKESLLNSESYSRISLTNKGMIEAEKIMYKHRLIEMFLIKKLNYKIEELRGVVHNEAHELEHSFSDESIRRIDKMLNYPKKTSSGKIIPRGKC